MSRFIGKMISRQVKRWATADRIKATIKSIATNDLIKDLVVSGISSLETFIDEPKERAALATKANKAINLPVIDEEGEQKLFAEMIDGLYKILKGIKTFAEKVEVLDGKKE